jgi:3-polyprenyl-4-hydroxybenzoate decarboxylase
MKIILGLTGSVATSIAPKIAKALREVYNSEVICVMTEKAKTFCHPSNLSIDKFKTFSDKDEWTWEHQNEEYSPVLSPDSWYKNDPILHIDLIKDASALVIAPASMNTIAKMTYGLNDNLLTSLYAAWDNTKPIIIAPAMNTKMYLSPANQSNLLILRNRGVHIVDPIDKKLACGEKGIGALADVNDIAKVVKGLLTWSFPLNKCSGIPINDHLGAFGAFRKHGKRHCGIDLYTNNNEVVYAVESGKVVSIEKFTGASIGSPWWNETMAVKIEGASGVVTYGEIIPQKGLKVSDTITKNGTIGFVTPVLKDGEIREDIAGHSLSMLHLQLYKHGMFHKDESWMADQEIPEGVLDPTPFLLESNPSIKKLEKV